MHMQKLSIKEAEKAIIGSGKRATLVVDSQTLIQVFGSPEYADDWDKVQYMWAFKDGDKIITIYDYKEKRDLSKINEWSVGGKNVMYVDVIQFVREKFEAAGEEYRELA